MVDDAPGMRLGVDSDAAAWEIRAGSPNEVIVEAESREALFDKLREMKRLAKIGQAVVERVDEEGRHYSSHTKNTCPACDRAVGGVLDHTDSCPLSRYLQTHDDDEL